MRLSGLTLLAVASSALISACGGSGEAGDQFPDEAAGEYPVEVVGTEFKRRQFVGRTYALRIAVRNTGDETVPALVATIDLPGRDSTLAFATRDPQPGLAQPQRPVWVMEAGYPKLAGTIGRGGAATANRRTFNFRELPPGETAVMVWRVTALEPGLYRLVYEIDAGLGLDTSAVDSEGEIPAGALPVRVTDRAVPTKVNRKGNVVPLTPQEQLQLELNKAD
jgi:hypothetical protein